MIRPLTVIMIIVMSFITVQAHAECTQSEMGNKEIIGTLAGAALGGLVGSQFGGGMGNKIAIGAGVVAGGFLGNKIGAELDCKDQQYHYETTQNALEAQKTGQASTWSNPDTGHSGQVIPNHTYTSANGMPCRDFTQTIYVDGKYEEVKGSACREPDGTWKPVS
jgi:surface antigen